MPTDDIELFKNKNWLRKTYMQTYMAMLPYFQKNVYFNNGEKVVEALEIPALLFATYYGIVRGV